MPKGRLSSYMAKPGDGNVKWYHVDAADKTLGRLAVKLARVLMGKHKAEYTPHTDVGDFIVVTNCERIRVTGKKAQTMVYPRYSYYPGGYKEIPFDRMLKTFPDRILTEAVRRMLPKSSLGKNMLKKLKVYAGGKHPHAAQQPEPLK
ncbi:MAG: 50S ribosomal protein L13 [Planctomycetota bacterium]